MIERDITMTCVSNEVGGLSATPVARRAPRRTAARGRRAGRRRPGRRPVDRRLHVRLPARSDGRPRRDRRRRHERRAAAARTRLPGAPRRARPVRLHVATKWLTEIELTTFAEFEHYWVRRGWAEKAPIKLMSRIDAAGPRQCRPARSPSAAWPGPRPRHRQVEVQIDDGEWAGGARRPGHGGHLAPVGIRVGRHAGATRSVARHRWPARSKPRNGPNQSPTVPPASLDRRLRRLTATAAVAVRSRAPSSGARFAPIETGYRWTGPHARSCDAPTGPEWQAIPVIPSAWRSAANHHRDGGPGIPFVLGATTDLAALGHRRG